MHVLVQVSAEFMYELEIYAVFHLYQVQFQVQERERDWERETDRERGKTLFVSLRSFLLFSNSKYLPVDPHGSRWSWILRTCPGSSRSCYWLVMSATDMGCEICSKYVICQRTRISHLIWLSVIPGSMSSFYSWVSHGRKGEGVA